MTASDEYRSAAGVDSDDESVDDCSVEAIEAAFASIDRLIKNFHSPHPLDEHNRPIPPPPDLTSKVDSGNIRKRKQKRGKRAKR